MADENLTLVYISGSFGGKQLDCTPTYFPKEVVPETNSWPFVVEAPDPSLKNPTFDWNNHKWVSQDEASQGQQLNDLQQSVGQLAGKVEKIDQATTKIDSSAKQSDEKVDQLTKLVAMSTNQIGQLGTAINQLGTIVNKLNPSATTDKKEEGAN